MNQRVQRLLAPIRGHRRLASILGLCLAAGCVTPVEEPAPVVFVEPLAPPAGVVDATPGAVDPVDVHVAEVEDATTGRGVPAEGLRRELYVGLVRRLYSPLALEFGDASLAAARSEAADGERILGPPEADAVLSARVVTWDTRQLESRGLIDVEVEVRLLDQRDGQVVQRWGRRVGRQLRLEQGLLKQATPGELQQYGARLLASELLQILPERDPY
ncbi:MAG: hypothetical protein AAFZ65_02575 [Planctomycetota bacterium]